MFFEEQLNYFSEISTGVFLSAWGNVNAKSLKEQKIKHVLNVAKEISYYLPDDIDYLKLDLVDKHDEIIDIYFNQVVDFIESARLKQEGVLIHCQYGMSRSPALLAAWVLFDQVRRGGEADVAAAMQTIQDGRAMVSTQPGFIKQLTAYAEQLNQDLLASASCSHAAGSAC